MWIDHRSCLLRFHNNARRKRKQNQSIVLAEHFANEGLEILEGLPDLPEDEEGTGMDSTDGNPMDGLSLEGTEVDNEEGEGEPIVEGEEYEEHTEEMEGMDQDVGETEETEATEGETEYSSGLPGEVWFCFCWKVTILMLHTNSFLIHYGFLIWNAFRWGDQRKVFKGHPRLPVNGI